MDLFPAWKQTLFCQLYKGKMISGRERLERGEGPVNFFHVASGRENNCGVGDVLLTLKQQKQPK